MRDEGGCGATMWYMDVCGVDGAYCDRCLKEDRLNERIEKLENEVHDLANNLVYHGNSVHHWYTKGTAYRDVIGKCWKVLEQHGYYPDGHTSIVQVIERALSERGKK